MQAPFADPLSGLDALRSISPLVGREAEMQLMRAVLDVVALDLPVGARALTISGETGIGKTRLLVEMCAEANTRGFRILEGHTYQFGNALPYFPFVEALRPILRTASRAQLRQWLGLDENEQEAFDADGQKSAVVSLVGTPLVAALATLFPELPKQLRVTLVPEVLSLDQVKFRLLDAVATLLERMAQEQPILLCIDNLQWADSASLELTLYLTVRLHRSRVALVGSTRPPEVTSNSSQGQEDDDPLAPDARVIAPKAALAATRALSELVRQGLLLVLPPGPLTGEASEQHLHYLLPETLPPDIAASLLARAGGNPFFLEELVRMLTLKGQLLLRNGTWQMTHISGQELPASIMQAVGERLQGRSAACRNLLRVAALFGRTFPLNALLQVAESREETVLTLVDEAERAALIAPFPGTHSSHNGSDDDAFEVVPEPALPVYLFCQGIVQEVLSAEIAPSRLRTLHAAIGSALEAAYGDMAAAHAAELARHYALGGAKAAALRWSLLAGEDAAHQQVHREAIGHFRRAISLLEAGIRPDREQDLLFSRFSPSLAHLYTASGESWFKLGELEQAAEAFQKALQAMTPPVPALQFAQTNRLLSDVYRMQGKYDQAMAHLQSARDALDAEHGEKGQEAGSAVPWFVGRSFASGGSLLTRERVSTSERILFLQAQATLYILLNRAAEAEKALWQSHQLAVEMGDRGSQAFALHMVGWLRGWGEHIQEAIRLQKQAHELYISTGDPLRATLGEQGLGFIYQALGEMETARRYTEQGIERARRYGVRYSLGWLYWNQGAFALAQGDWEASARHFQAALHEAEATNNSRLLPIVLQARAELRFRQGHWHEAEQDFQACITAAANTEWYPGAMALYGHFLAVTGRHAAARTQLDRAAAHVEPPGYGSSFYIPFLAEGYLHLGDSERAAAYIERIRSLRGFMYSGNSVDRILGVVAAQEGRWEMADQAFEEGLALCRRASNAPEEAMILYEQARAALLRSGHETEQEQTRQTLQRVHRLCEQARAIFLRYNMQRAAAMVDTLQDGVRQLEQREHSHQHEYETAKTKREPFQKAAKLVIEEMVPGYTLDLSLTKREQEVLRLVAEGHTDREVAETLVISPRTVNRHLSNIFVKLDVPGRAAAVAYAIRQGLV
ncbi:MAG TPA: AAA family ATPase [Ktedonobacteraceae bacterium]|nr:AAA family ATPase [Ktedonobacteraceae bacterium]